MLMPCAHASTAPAVAPANNECKGFSFFDIPEDLILEVDVNQVLHSHPRCPLTERRREEWCATVEGTSQRLQPKKEKIRRFN